MTLGGVAAFDFDNDGCADVFFTNGAAIPSLRKTGGQYANRLFRNNGNLTFTDVTEENDGLVDLFVAGVTGNILYRNLGGGRFAEITARAGLNAKDPRWAVSAGLLDYDNDGWLDLFVSNSWSGMPRPNLDAGLRNASITAIPTPIAVCRINCSATTATAFREDGHAIAGMGSDFRDIDNDGGPDLIVSGILNDSFLLFRNSARRSMTSRSPPGG